MLRHQSGRWLTIDEPDAAVVVMLGIMGSVSLLTQASSQ